MPGLDETKQFVPLKIAVLTISDTRSLQERQVGGGAGPAHRRRRPLRRRAQHRCRRYRGDPHAGQNLDRRSGDRRHHHHRRHRLHRPRRHPGSDRAAVRQEDGRLLGAVPGGEFSKIGTSAIQSRATAGVAGSTYIFCLPGSPRLQRAWDEILVHQLDYRYGPCNFVEIMPRLDDTCGGRRRVARRYNTPSSLRGAQRRSNPER